MAVPPARAVEDAHKMCDMIGVGRRYPTLTTDRHRDHNLGPPAKTSLRGIVARFLTRRPTPKESPVSPKSPSASPKPETVPTPRVLRSKTREESREYRKSVVDLDLEKPMDGVGFATGNGDGDMRGVIIKDFACVQKDPPASRSRSKASLSEDLE